MRVYLDASVLVAVLTRDASNDRAGRMLRGRDLSIVLSDFAIAEFTSSVSRRVRTGFLTFDEALSAFEAVDLWSSDNADRIETTSADIRAAETMMRRLDLPLRTPDALNIALARRVEATLATFDRQMAGAARALGLDVID